MNTTLDGIVRSYKISIGHNTLHGYVRMMKFLIDFVQSFSLSNTVLDYNVVLKVDEKKAVQWPADCVLPSSISFQSGDRLIRFQMDPRININPSYCDDSASATPDIAYQVYQSWPYNQPNIDLIEAYQHCNESLGRGDNGLGYFKINWRNREVQFNANSPSPGRVLLSYKSTGVNPKADSTLPSFAVKTAEAYIHWQMAAMDRNLGEASAEAQARNRRFLITYDEMQAQIDPIDIESIIGAKARSTDVNKFIS